VIKDVEGLRPEFERHVLSDREMLEQCHIDVPVAGIAQEIPSRIAQRQTHRCGKSIGIGDVRPETGPRNRLRNVLRGVGNHVSVGLTSTRARRHAITKAGVVRVGRAVIDAEWCSRLPTADAGQFPVAQ